MNKLVALNFISVCLLSLGYRSNRVITLGVSSVFLFALGVYFVGSWRRPGAADVNWWCAPFVKDTNAKKEIEKILHIEIIRQTVPR